MADTKSTQVGTIVMSAEEANRRSLLRLKATLEGRTNVKAPRK